jgi:hypothetical protein
LGYQATAYRFGGLQPMLWVEHAEVEDEHWLLMLLSPAARGLSGEPVSPWSAKILFISYSFHSQKVWMNTLANSTALVEPARRKTLLTDFGVETCSPDCKRQKFA